jgi:hypothetical protein
VALFLESDNTDRRAGQRRTIACSDAPPDNLVLNAAKS